MATIAIVHFGLAGHVAPATRLGRVVAAEGHRVMAWAPEAYREPIESSGAEHRQHNPAQRRSWWSRGFQAALIEGAQRHVGTLIEEMHAEQVDLVIHDCFALWGQVAADFLGLPRIVSYPLFPFSPGTANGREAWRAHPQARQAAMERAELNRRLIEREWGIDIRGWEGAKPSTGVLTANYTIEEIGGAPATGADWEFVGPLLEPRPPQLRADPPLVYVCLGTFWTFRRKAYRVAIDALADEPVEVVVSTGRGLVTPASLEPLPANVTACDFVDARDVLSRARVHITHGGIGSVHESLMAGVPMVCLPQGIDQFAWAEHAERLGVGKRADPTPEAVCAAVSRLLHDDQPRDAAQALGQKLARYDGAARVLKLVERALTGRARTTV